MTWRGLICEFDDGATNSPKIKNNICGFTDVVVSELPLPLFKADSELNAR